MSNNETLNPEVNEIDPIALAKQLWKSRKRILIITGYFIVVGLAVAIFSPKSYTAICQVVPQTNKNSSNASMARLASLAGVNLGNLSASDQLLSPTVYPNILNNAAFQRELLQTKINIKQEKEPITLLTYLTDKKYRKISPVGFVMKYTIGLPGVIMQAIKGEPKESEMQFPKSDSSKIIVFNRKETSAIKQLKEMIIIELTEKKGTITIMAKMPEAYAAAQVAENTFNLLSKYIIDFKIDKVRSNLEFIQGRYDVLKKEYEAIHRARAQFKDANMRTTANVVRAKAELMDNQYAISYAVFSEMASQLEQAQIQVKETTPIMTVINPVSVPTRPTAPRRMVIMAGFTFLGLLAGSGYVLFKRKEEE